MVREKIPYLVQNFTLNDPLEYVVNLIKSVKKLELLDKDSHAMEW